MDLNIAKLALRCSLVAVGNRCWGSGAFKHGHLIGALLMTAALWIGSGEPLWTVAVTFAAVYAFRGWHDGDWLNMLETANINWSASFIRSLAIFPLVALKVYLHQSPWELVRGCCVVASIPTIYWLCGRLEAHLIARGWKDANGNNFDGDALAELLVGVMVGIL